MMLHTLNSVSLKKWARKVLRTLTILGHIGAAIHGVDFIVHAGLNVVGTAVAKAVVMGVRF